ncbi:hypothetical protein B0H14DRAFT_2630167 [Mycena olivaceomarginata]|nr:hypothetical protein B0H14DRAFT_2630167 [Mycena olivaceomarginata]
MPPVRRTTGRATRCRPRPNYRDHSSVRSPPVLVADGIRAELRANANTYGREIIHPRMTLCVGREIRVLDTRGIINNEFESETLQITPAGRGKFAAIEADAEGVVANDPSEGATLAALFDVSRVAYGSRADGPRAGREGPHDRRNRTSCRTGSLQHTTPVPTQACCELPAPASTHPLNTSCAVSTSCSSFAWVTPQAQPAPRRIAQVRTLRRLLGAKSMPYPSPESLPRRQGVGAATPVSPSPSARSRGASPMEVDDDGADEVLVVLSLVPTPSTSASASIYAPRQTSDAEVQCDPSETETQLADVQAELLEAQANYAQATWNANKAELEAEVRVLREAKNRAEMARWLWSENAVRLAAETTGF